MEIFKYILLGILQGVSEPIPVSSSGHLYLFKEIFNTNLFDSLNFEIIANFGSFIAIFIIFYKDIVDLIQHFLKFIFSKDKENSKSKFTYCIYVVISTIPTIITGLLFSEYFENYSIKTLGCMFLVTATMLFLVRKNDGDKEDKDITLLDAIIIGLFQSVAILPGISRSGAVLVGCLICKLKRDTALKYTFILYFPVSLGAMILGASDLMNAQEAALLLPYTLGAISAGIVTFFSYKWLSDWVKKGKLAYFSIYCILLSLFIFIYFR
ncbi:MAG: undecaprenyl-diphosphate phosphatase [bacterium]